MSAPLRPGTGARAMLSGWETKDQLMLALAAESHAMFSFKCGDYIFRSAGIFQKGGKILNRLRPALLWCGWNALREGYHLGKRRKIFVRAMLLVKIPHIACNRGLQLLRSGIHAPQHGVVPHG